MVEKPSPSDAPSNLAVVGRYILEPEIFDYLAGLGRGAGGEIQLTDGLARLLTDHPVRAFQFDGTRFDCGSKLGYLEATLHYALRHRKLGESFTQFVKQIADSV